MRRLNAISGIVAGGMIVVICVLIVAQIVARLFGFVLPGADEFAIAAFVAAVFIGLPYTLASGGHVRADVIVLMFSPAWRRRTEILVHVVALAFIAYFAYYAANLAWSSYLRNTKFQGLLGSPLWIPQASIVLGLVLLELALIQGLFRTLRERPAEFVARSTAQEGVE